MQREELNSKEKSKASPAGEEPQPSLTKETETEEYQNAKAILQKLCFGAFENIHNFFYGISERQNFVEAYKWVYVLDRKVGLDVANHFLSAQDQQEFNKICDVLADKLTEPQIKLAHRMADEFIQSLDKPDEPANSMLRRPIPSAVKREVWRRDEGKCTRCGGREQLEYDHIIPVSKGGSNTARNIELLCEQCNRSKSASI
jgi:HNH endonuclease